jgi:hypothetical protein
MAMNVQMLIFWEYTPCNVVGINRYFVETYCLHLQVRWKMEVVKFL